jgi:hypothetical protein
MKLWNNIFYKTSGNWTNFKEICNSLIRFKRYNRSVPDPGEHSIAHIVEIINNDYLLWFYVNVFLV